MNFQTIKPGDRIKGLISGEIVQIITTQPIGNDAIEVYYRRNDSTLGQQLIFADSIDNLSLETEKLPWKFDADAAQVRLTSEAYRIKLAHLFDGDRFEGKNRSKMETNASDIMRRLVKEELLTFECKRLFPERFAYTLKYELSEQEMELYNRVTDYVRTSFDMALKALDQKRANAVGFALTVLRRRLAYSPEAIHQSLRRRRERLEKKLEFYQTARDMHGASLEPDFQEDFTEEDWDEYDDNSEEEVNFGDRPLRELLIEAICYGNSPEVRAKLEKTIDGALDRTELERIIAERSLAGQSLGIEQVHEIKEAMERIEARSLQPHFIESFFIGAFENMKDQIRKRSDHRYTIPHVPRNLRESRSKPPTVLGGALIVPRSMIPTGVVGVPDNSTEEGRDEIERIAMQTIMEIERELGNAPKDVSKDNPGYDNESKTQAGSLRFIEVKAGIQSGAGKGNFGVRVQIC